MSRFRINDLVGFKKHDLTAKKELLTVGIIAVKIYKIKDIEKEDNVSKGYIGLENEHKEMIYFNPNLFRKER